MPIPVSTIQKYIRLTFSPDGSLILENGDVLEINTTVPSIVKKDDCSFYASHQTRNSTKVAYVTFRGNVELNKGSKVIVTGEYALSITSQNGSIDIQTDVNMTCNSGHLNSTCLGGFTQSSQATERNNYKIFRGKGTTFHFFFSSSIVFTIFFVSICFNFALNSQLKYLTI